MGLSAVVLAGTHRWSGSVFESLAPRPLVPVALAPLISYALIWLRQGGVQAATVCANGTFIEDAFGDGSELGMELSYYEDGTPRGPAGCVRDAGMLTGSQTLVVTHGTAIPTADLGELLASHHASGAAVTAVVHHEGSLGAPPTPGGVYVFDRRVLDHVPRKGFQDIKENLIPRLRRAGERVVAYESEGFSPHVFDAQTYLQVNQWMLLRRFREDERAGTRSLLHASARVEPGARLVGPVQLGPGAHIEAGATIVGPTTIGPDSTIGRNAMVARSVVWTRCAIGEGSVVHGCIVGNDAVIPPASRLFNVVRPQRTPQASPLRASLWSGPLARSVPPSAGSVPTS